jgi:hypothetical protein
MAGGGAGPGIDLRPRPVIGRPPVRENMMPVWKRPRSVAGRSIRAARRRRQIEHRAIRTSSNEEMIGCTCGHDEDDCL